MRLIRAFVAGIASCSLVTAPLAQGITGKQLAPGAAATNLRWIDPTAPAYGAKCDGSTDDSTALQNAINALGSQTTFFIPGVCVFKSPLTFPAYSYDLTILGNGMNSMLLYKGSTTTGNLVTIGTANYSGGCSTTRLTLRDVNFASGTMMTAGDGVQANELCDSDISNINVGGDFNQSGEPGANNYFYNGIHFNGGNSVHVRGLNASAGQGGAAELVNGDSAHQFTDLYQTQSKIINSVIGIELAGWVGGFTLGQTDILGNQVDFQIDQSVVATPSGGIFFEPGVALDATNGGAGINLNITDPGNSGGSGSDMYLTGTWTATGNGSNGCINVASGSYWHIVYTGGTIQNCAAGGLVNNSTHGLIQMTGVHMVGNSTADLVNNGSQIFESGDYSGSSTHATGTGYILGTYMDSAGSLHQNAAFNVNIQGDPSHIAVMGIRGNCGISVLGGGGVVGPTYSSGSGAHCSATLGSATYSWAGVVSDNFQFASTVAVGSLPTCNSAERGTYLNVNDQNGTPTYGGTLTGGGGLNWPVFCDGSTWRAH